MTIAAKGLQLLDESGVFECLYKNVREVAWRAAGKDGSHTVIADGSGNGYTLSSPANAHICNGPMGKAGWDDVAAPYTSLQFARRFASTLTGDVWSAVIDSAVPVAANAEHTVQVAFRWEWDLATVRGIHATALNTAGTGIGNDYINRIISGTDGSLKIFTENNDTNLTGSSSANAIRPGLWQFLTLVFKIQDATNFDCRIFVHTKESNGTITGIGGHSLGFDQQVTTLRCNTASGLTDGRITYGQENLGTNDYIGDIGLGRFVKEALSDADADAQAREFLSTGTIATWGSNDLYRHEFNEEPDLVDEGPYGLHVWSQGDAFGEAEALDIVGTGGAIFRNTTSSNRYVARNYSFGATLQDLLGHSQPVYFADFFTDELATVPEWTFQFIGSMQSEGTSLQMLYLNQASGESLATNHVVSASILKSTGALSYFAERASGTNITLASTSGAAKVSDAETMAVRLYTLRCDEDPGSPGTMRLRLSENDDIDVLTHTTSGVPQGGESNTGLDLRAGTADSFLQEFAFYSRALTDEEIVAAYQNIGVASVVLPYSPPASELGAGVGKVGYVLD